MPSGCWRSDRTRAGWAHNPSVRFSRIDLGMIRRRRPLLVAVVVVASSLVACSLPHSMRLLPFSTARHLMFGLATERDGPDALPLTHIEVVSCRRISADLSEVPPRTFWLAMGWDTQPESRVHPLTYGRTPPRLRDKIAARKLEPGCYHASVAVEPGGASVTFWVMADDRVRAVWTDSARLGSYDCDFFRRYDWSQFGDRR